MNKEAVWVQFATALLGRIQTLEIDRLANMADLLTQQWDNRFGDGAFLLEGQRECAACKTPIEPGDQFMASVDGVKFCDMDCLKISGRAE